jgi:two-component system sensor histidine kinase QseC
MATVDAATLGTRVEVGPLPSELQPMVSRLNELLARLAAAFARERRFTATAAHELRTPLAELRSLAEVNLATPATEAERTESWQDVLATTRRMESLALKLLDLARTENGKAALSSESVVLRQAVATAWQGCAGCAAKRGVGIHSGIPEHLTVDTDPVLLGVVLSNLCANAAKHAPDGAMLHIDAAQAGNTTTLTFRNPAPDLTTDDISHLFERFWRKDAARTDGRHHGLGLALAAEFASLLGGRLNAKLTAAGELEMTLEFSAGAL